MSAFHANETSHSPLSVAYSTVMSFFGTFFGVAIEIHLPSSPPSEGIPHITIGDGGNREHFAVPWIEEQPKWSALREYAYGWGTLELNRTHAVWSWLRNNDPWNPPGGRVGDYAVLKAKA